MSPHVTRLAEHSRLKRVSWYLSLNGTLSRLCQQLGLRKQSLKATKGNSVSLNERLFAKTPLRLKIGKSNRRLGGERFSFLFEHCFASLRILS